MKMKGVSIIDLHLTAIRTISPNNKIQNITHFKFSNDIIKSSYDITEFFRNNDVIDIYYFDKYKNKQFLELSVLKDENISFPSTLGFNKYFGSYEDIDPLLTLPRF